MADEIFPTIVSRSASLRSGSESEAKNHENDTTSSRGCYNQISTIRKALELCYIVIGNCICSGLIAVCLLCFSRQPNMSQWSKRSFNTLALLLSGAMGFGIGFLFDRIGIMARGKLLQSGFHSAKSVCMARDSASRPHTNLTYSFKQINYIMKGTLSSYALLLLNELRTCKHLRTIFPILLYLITSLIGRFGVGFIGLTFNLNVEVSYIAPLMRPDWSNGQSQLSSTAPAPYMYN